ncbi:MAG: hypothetical protein VKL42_08635 [Snowella sp.]|nr:hypothetical protein [Snowella sp.]
MRYLTKIIGISGLVSACLITMSPQASWANTGSAITGDSGAGNPDSSTFMGDFFGSPPFGGSVNQGAGGAQAGGRQRPKNWKCNIPYKNQEGSLRFKTVATMLSTNLAGSDSINLLEAKNIITGPNGQDIVSNQGPLFSCADSLTLRPAPITATNSPDAVLPTSPTSPTDPTAPGSAASLGGVIQPTISPTVPSSLPSTTTETASTPAEPPSRSVSLVDYFNRPVETPFPFVSSGARAQQSLQTSLKLPIVPDMDDPLAGPDTDPEVIKSKTLRDLITTLQGLTTEKTLPEDPEKMKDKVFEKTLPGDPQGESLVDINQFAAAIKTYNELIAALDEQQLRAWSNDRYGQDITATLKKLRTTCNCGWADRDNTTAGIPSN